MNLLKVNVQQSILTLAGHGWSRRRIARELNVDRATVRRHLEAARANAAISTLGSESGAEANAAISTLGSAPAVEPTTVGTSKCSSVAGAGRKSVCEPLSATIEGAVA